MNMSRRLLPKAVFLLGFQLLITTGVARAMESWSFEGRRYYEPLTAGVRDAHLSALALASADRMAFAVRDDDPRRVWDIDLGAELPLFGWESEASVKGRVPPGAFGFGFWLPIDFHMIEDMVDESGPILNTDYRFGLMAKAQWGRPGNQWWSIRVFGGHESTHLGDEFSIVGQRQFPRTFERINVSWEYIDVGVLYEREPGLGFWSLRGGLTATVPFGDSYYEVGPGTITESRIGPVTESENWIDPYAGFERRWNERIRERWDVYLSGELRWRTVYDYHKAHAGAAEERQASLNLIAGVKKSGTPRVSPFIRFYHGVNPHGQFRNQKDFTQLGIGLRLVP